MTTSDYLGSLLGPYSGMLPGATTSDILASPIGGSSTDSNALDTLQQLLQGKGKGNSTGSQNKQKKNHSTGGGNNSLRRLPDSVNNSVNENRRIAKALIARRYPQWDRSDYRSLVKLWNRESGWDAKAENSTSSASGIPQMMLSVHHVPSDYQRSPITQEQVGLRYIRGRYGDPDAAWRHSQATGWY